MGYQAFSSFLASDDEALVVRKFSAVHVRTILMLQDEIVQLEEQLAIMDHDIEQTVVAKEDEDGGAKHDDDHGKDNHKCDEA